MGTTYAVRLHEGLHATLAGDPALLVAVADEALDQVGGRLWSDYRQVASVPDQK